MTALFDEEFKKYLILEDGICVGSITDEDSKMLKWMERKNIWKNGDDVIIETKYPVLKKGDLVYHLDDENKEPYKWKIWDNSERICEDYDFIDHKKSVYLYKLKKPWN